MPQSSGARSARHRLGAPAAAALAVIVALGVIAALAAVPGTAIASGGGGSGGAGFASPSGGAGHSGPRSGAAHHGHRPQAGPSRAANPLSGRAMWIWELPYVEQGNVAQIVSVAHRYGVGTLLVKSSDGTTGWPQQFNRQFVAELHAGGLHVCAWQYVYGTHPVTEAYLGAGAIHDGADCLVIDAESEYEGRYIQAQTYIDRLRKLIGPRFPVALAGFPFVDFHPAFPYSVFLGPGGAQLDVPQMYWHAIGVSTDAVFAHTYSDNLVYGRPIVPLGQVYGTPPIHQIVRFRQLSRAYGAPGVSWWDWQEARASDWSALSRPAGPLRGYVPYTTMAPLSQGAQGDMVVWAQEHLVSAREPVAISGQFGYHTLLAVQAFQAAHGLAVDGTIGEQTWTALLRYRPVTVRWLLPHHGHGLAVATARRAVTAPVPASASLPARHEIGAVGRGGR